MVAQIKASLDVDRHAHRTRPALILNGRLIFGVRYVYVNKRAWPDYGHEEGEGTVTIGYTETTGWAEIHYLDGRQRFVLLRLQEASGVVSDRCHILQRDKYDPFLIRDLWILFGEDVSGQYITRLLYRMDRADGLERRQPYERIETGPGGDKHEWVYEGKAYPAEVWTFDKVAGEQQTAGEAECRPSIVRGGGK